MPSGPFLYADQLMDTLRAKAQNRYGAFNAACAKLNCKHHETDVCWVYVICTDTHGTAMVTCCGHNAASLFLQWIR